jgi:hypothetical protein
MQTFLPYKSFARSARCLDNRRLGKQRVEAMQILDVLCGEKAKTGWRNHPAVLQWKGHEGALYAYLEDVCAEWVRRGFDNSGMAVHLRRLTSSYRVLRTHTALPPWLGKKAFHNSHRSRLLQKDKDFYSQYGWKVPLDLECVWPARNGAAAAVLRRSSPVRRAPEIES